MMSYIKYLMKRSQALRQMEGHYSSSDITKAMDNDFDTRWHSGKQNNANFTMK